MVKLAATNVIVMILQLLISFALMEQSATGLELTPKMMMTIKKLQDLVSKSEEPKGTPFLPLISKPEPCQRVAIVGAGIAGLHMAYELKKKGFNNIVVLEKECRAGGKVMSTWHDGVPHEMGACYTSPDYANNVYALAKELGVDDFVPRPTDMAVWLDKLPFPIDFKTFTIGMAKKLSNARTVVEAVGNLIDATYRYSVLHRKMFGKYQGEMMYKPSKEVLSQLNQTFMSFLAQHNLLALVPVLTTVHTMQGYGHIDRVPAVYAMFWNTPNFLSGMLAISLGLNAGKHKSEIFRNGFQQLTDKLAALTDVRLNVMILDIKRDSTGVTIKYREEGRPKTEKFDFLIWAADTREALQVLKDPTPLEKEFLHLKNTWFTTTLFEGKEVCPTSATIEYWMDNIYGKREHSVWARRHSKYVIKGGNCTRNIGKNLHESMVSYQMGDQNPNGGSIVRRKFLRHYALRQHEEDIRVVQSETWNYFPRFSVAKAADGILWKIAENQGNRKTWYVGSSVIFESTKSVMEYNYLMMRRMEMCGDPTTV